MSQAVGNRQRGKNPGRWPLSATVAITPARPFPGSFVRFECGHWGDGVTWSHSHADRLSFSFYLDSEPVFTDPGTGFYLQDQAMRDYLRSTRAHTTATIDGLSQGTPLSTFFWEKEIGSSLLDSVATDCEIMLEGILGKRIAHRGWEEGAPSSQAAPFPSGTENGGGRYVSGRGRAQSGYNI